MKNLLSLFFLVAFAYSVSSCEKYAVKYSHEKSHKGCSSNACDYSAIKNAVEMVKRRHPNVTYNDIKKDDFDLSFLKKIEKDVIKNYIENYKLGDEKIGYYPRIIENYYATK